MGGIEPVVPLVLKWFSHQENTMNATERLTRLLKTPRPQIRGGWFERFALKVNKIPVLWLTTTGKGFGVLFVFMGLVLGFISAPGVLPMFWSIMALVLAVSVVQYVYSERVSEMGETSKGRILTLLENLQKVGTENDQTLVRNIATLLENPNQWHAFWWQSLRYALEARIQEHSAVVEVEAPLEQRLFELKEPTVTPKQLKL